MAKQNLISETITDQNKHTFPKEIQQAYEYVAARQNEILFEEQYFATLEVVIKEEIDEFILQQSRCSAKSVVIRALHGPPEQISTTKLKKIADMVLTYWNSLTQLTSATAQVS